MRGFAALEGSQCTGAKRGWRGIGASPPALMRKISRKSLPLSHGMQLSAVGGRISGPTPIRRRSANVGRFHKGGGSGRWAGLLLRAAGEGGHAKHGGAG